MNTKFEGIWKLLNQYDFGIDSQYLRDLTCVICKKILIEGRQAPCACKYCYKCINCYLNNGKKLCPGSNEECKEEELQIDINIVADYSTMRKISKLKVRCPLEICSYEDELSNIETHLQVCNAKAASCPYVPIGCNELTIASDKLKDHLNFHSNNHAKLMIDTIENLKNQLKVNETEYQNKINDLVFQNEILKEENNKMKIDILKVLQDNDDLTMKCQIIEENQREIEEKINRLNEIKENNSINEDLDEIRLDIEDIEDNVEIFMGSMNYLKTTLKTKEFVWRIENLSEKTSETSFSKTDKFIFSDSFDTHKNGYKMCLYACPSGFGKSKGFFGIFFKLLIGQYDDILPWPCKINVTIQLINQNSGTVYLARERKYENNSNNQVYQKPINVSKGLGYSHFIKLDELLGQTELLQRNQLFIKCITDALD